eukprot:1158262-Pelagomonas_calceolata.AAC.2
MSFRGGMQSPTRACGVVNQPLQHLPPLSSTPAKGWAGAWFTQGHHGHHKHRSMAGAWRTLGLKPGRHRDTMDSAA